MRTHAPHLDLLTCLLIVFLPSALLPGAALSGEPGAPPALPSDDVDFLIVTNDVMAPEFQRLADAREAEGLRSRVVTIAWVQSVTPAARDLQETLREFLRAAYLDWGIEYLLLGGDDPVLPARITLTAPNIWPGDQWDAVCDLYFAGLNGNWDADRDGIYGEFAGDDADLVPELKVGRAPVNDAAEAAVFVDKTLAYSAASNLVRLDDALLLAAVLAPYPWWSPEDPVEIDGAEQAERVAALLTGAQPSFRISRLYENSGAYAGAFPLSRQSAIDSLSSGRYGLVSFVGHADAEEWQAGDGFETLTLDDMAGLSNAGAPFIVEALACDAADVRDTTMFEVMLRNPGGGCAAAIGPSGLAFVASGFALQNAFFTAATASRVGRLGEIMVATLDDLRGQPTWDPSVQMGAYHAVISYVLLGDPTLRIGPASLTAVPSAPPRAVAVAVEQCVPNPFNPIGRVRFSIAGPEGVAISTTVGVYDIRGRLQRTLLDRPLPPGPHEAVWDGRDEAGQALPSGLYLVRVEAAGAIDSGKFMLVR